VGECDLLRLRLSRATGDFGGDSGGAASHDSQGSGCKGKDDPNEKSSEVRELYQKMLESALEEQAAWWEADIARAEREYVRARRARRTQGTSAAEAGAR
jgi:hypothetical protein